MRRAWSEGMLVGVLVGVLVMLLRALAMDGLGAQVLGLALAALILCVVQGMLLFRRARRDTATPGRDRSALLQRAALRQNPFTREADQSWTGLVDHPTDAAPHDGDQPPARDEERF